MTDNDQPINQAGGSRPSISAFFPAYNDGGTIPSRVLAALMTLRDLSDGYEVIVVNDSCRPLIPDS